MFAEVTECNTPNMGFRFIPKRWCPSESVRKKIYDRCSFRNPFDWSFTQNKLTFHFFIAQYRAYMLHNITVDLCSSMSGKWDPIINIFEKDLRKYSNFYLPCPRHGRFHFKSDGLDLINFPPILPDGFYRATFYNYQKYKNKEHLIFTVIAHIEIIPIGIERFWKLIFK